MRFRVLAILTCAVLAPWASAVVGTGDSADGRLDTVAPSFADTTVEPALTLGDALTVLVRASEALFEEPVVTVNARPTSHVPDTEYDFIFLVMPGDRFRPGQLHIEGMDLVGNRATLNRTITVLAPLPVPLRPWLAIPLLLAAGCVALRSRRAASLLVFFALGLLVDTARAEHPAVSNVTFMQQPTAEGTEVIVHYDLSAPNGPCNVSLLVSRDRGQDGFPLTASAVSGALSGVSSGVGHTIRWDIAQDLPGEDHPSARLRLVADDGFAEYTVTYIATAGGTISGAATQYVVQGHDGTPVTAVADLGHHFVQWSDGLLSPLRTETSVSANVTVIALFAIDTFTLTYTAGPHGSISGAATQVVPYAGSGSPVTAVADPGYYFVKWSDGATTATRTDVNVMANLSVVAEFALSDLVIVDGGGFPMGRSTTGDDATYGNNDERPVHTVNLTPFSIGRYEVTVQGYCNALNYAFDPSRNYLRTSGGQVWSGSGDIYAGSTRKRIYEITSADGNIQFTGGLFVPKTRTGTQGTYSTANHPVQMVTWYGAVICTNWFSEMEGYTPVYDTNTWTANFNNNGYHLPTEAQWECAAAWDGTKHWIYGFTADTISNARANYKNVNPLGQTAAPRTSPVGWFNGVNVSPNGGVQTVNSVSPSGCYDMSGNVWEWCNDWYSSNYYTSSPANDPTGPASGTQKVFRGASWVFDRWYGRTAQRYHDVPSDAYWGIGFRLARKR